MSLVGFKAHSLRGKPCLTLLRWPWTWDWIGHEPWRILNITDLLKEHSNKTTPNNILLYSVLHSAATREASPCSRCQVTQKPTTRQYEENERLWTTQSQMSYVYQTSPLGAQGTMEISKVERLSEPKGMDDTKETVYSRHNRTDSQMNSQRLWQHA